MTWVLTKSSPPQGGPSGAETVTLAVDSAKPLALTLLPSHRIASGATSRGEAKRDLHQNPQHSHRPVAVKTATAKRGSVRRRSKPKLTVGEVARWSLGNWMVEELTPALVDGAVTGDPQALNRLVELLTPLVQVRIARILLRRSAGTAHHDIRQDVEDMVQEVFIQLFADGGKVLRSWKTDRGLSLANFVGLVAERRVISILRSGRRNPWREEPTAPEELDIAHQEGPENQVTSRDTLRRLLDRLEQSLSPLGWKLFQAIFVEEKSVAEIGENESMTADAVYAWRSRLRRQSRTILRELESDS